VLSTGKLQAHVLILMQALRKKNPKQAILAAETARVIRSQALLGSYSHPTASKLRAVVGKVKTFGLN